VAPVAWQRGETRRSKTSSLELHRRPTVRSSPGPGRVLRSTHGSSPADQNQVLPRHPRSRSRSWRRDLPSLQVGARAAPAFSAPSDRSSCARDRPARLRSRRSGSSLRSRATRRDPEPPCSLVRAHERAHRRVSSSAPFSETPQSARSPIGVRVITPSSHTTPGLLLRCPISGFRRQARLAHNTRDTAPRPGNPACHP
jgi:hypothetical protein